ncbi:protein piccolo-like [Chenopodium quinoa]|uniref:protein piccolo-like n=1 Tax=Chenopodium quinoa TaxID=63459 RepID=UPI000B780F34|nr:protein piccolo-like [Chenopodium quinoa]
MARTKRTSRTEEGDGSIRVPWSEVYYDKPGIPSTPEDSILGMPVGQQETEFDQGSSHSFSLTTSTSDSGGSETEQEPSEKPDEEPASPARGQVKPPVVPGVNLKPPKRTAEEAAPTTSKRSRKTVAHKPSASNSESHPSTGGKLSAALSALKQESETKASKDSPSAGAGSPDKRRGKQVQDLVVISEAPSQAPDLREIAKEMLRKGVTAEQRDSIRGVG